MLKRVYIEITNACNLSCSFCPGTKRGKRFMTPAEFKAIAEKVRPHTEYIYLHVMGEPLLHPQLGEILDIATKRGFKINITTNGTLISRKAELLRKYPSIRKVSISLHSYEGNHTADTVSDEAGDIVADMNPSGDDFYKYLEDVWSFASQAECIVALRLWNEGGANERNDEIIDFLSDKSGLDVRSIPDTANGRKLPVYNGRIYLESAVKFTWPTEQPDEQPVTFCHGLTQQMAVLCDGTVVPCCLDSDGTIALGNLFTEEFESIVNSARAQAFVQGFIDHCPSEELCRHCDYATRFS